MAQEVETQEVTTVSEVAPTKVVKTTKQVTPPIKTEPPQEVFETKKAMFRTYQVIWYILGVIEVLLLFRITFLALGASPLSPFVSLIYTISNPLALPFRGIFGITVVESRAVFEWSTIVAAVVYVLLAYGIMQLMQLIKPVTPEEVEQKVDTQ